MEDVGVNLQCGDTAHCPRCILRQKYHCLSLQKTTRCYSIITKILQVIRSIHYEHIETLGVFMLIGVVWEHLKSAVFQLGTFLLVCVYPNNSELLCS